VESSVGADSDAVPGEKSPNRLRWRKRLVLLLVVITSFGVLTSSVAVWTHRVLLNTDEWVETVGPVASDPAVQAAAANYLTDQAMSVLNAESLLQQALPDRVSFLASPLSSAVREFVHDAISKLLASDQFARLWVGINRVGHQITVNVLRGDTKFVQTDDGTVSINILPILARALQFVGDKVPGLVGGRTMPTDITFETPVDQARQELSTALGRDLPPNFGVFTLFQSDQLAAAQRAVVLFDRGVWALLIVTLLCGIAAIVLSVRRRRTLLQLGAGVALGMGISVGAIAAIKNMVLDLIVDPTNRAAAAATLGEVVGSFNVEAKILLAIGLLVALGAFLSGDHPWAKGLRNLVGRATGSATSVAADAYRNRSDQPFPWIVKHRAELAVLGAAVAVLWLLLADTTRGLLVVVVLLLAVYEAGVYVLGGRAPAAASAADAAPEAGADAPASA
jgi:O-antigen ligase